MDIKKLINNQSGISKKNQLIVVLGAFAIFSLVVMFDLFNVLYLHSINFFLIQKYFIIFEILSILIFAPTFILWTKPKSWVLYFVLPILISMVSWNITLWLFNTSQVKFLASQLFLYYAIFPYIPITWLLSACMLTLHAIFKIVQSK